MLDERRNETTAGTRKRGKTCVQGSSQKDRRRGANLRAASQSMIPALKASPAPTRETLEGSGESKLETYGTGEKHKKKA